MKEQIGGTLVVVWVVVTILFSFTSETALLVWTFNIIVGVIFVSLSYMDDDDYDYDVPIKKTVRFKPYSFSDIDHQYEAELYVDEKIAKLKANLVKQEKKLAKAEAKLLAYKKANNII